MRKNLCGIIACLWLSVPGSQAIAGYFEVPTAVGSVTETNIISKVAIGAFVTFGCVATIAGLMSRFRNSPAPYPAQNISQRQQQSGEAPPAAHHRESLHNAPDSPMPASLCETDDLPLGEAKSENHSEKKRQSYLN